MVATPVREARPVECRLEGFEAHREAVLRPFLIVVVGYPRPDLLIPSPGVRMEGQLVPAGYEPSQGVPVSLGNPGGRSPGSPLPADPCAGTR